jgi:hypothetical protein
MPTKQTMKVVAYVFGAMYLVNNVKALSPVKDFINGK